MKRIRVSSAGINRMVRSEIKRGLELQNGLEVDAMVQNLGSVLVLTGASGPAHSLVGLRLPAAE